jgi:hypothetical protein
MKILALVWSLILCSLVSSRADLIIVQKIEGSGQPAEMTMKIKGDKSRIDITPQLTTIFDGKTGETLQIMRDQKAVVRLSAQKMKAMTDTMKNYSGQTPTAEKPKLTPTGKKETINGYEAAEYVATNSTFKASYWIAEKFPDGAAILQQLRAINTPLSDPGNLGVPNFNDLPGLPIRTVISMGTNQITSTLVSVKQDPVNDSEFVVPKDFKEVKMPEVGSMLQEEGTKPATAAPSPGQ